MDLSQLLRSALLLLHALASAAWFGSIFYSLVVLHPRASQFFEQIGEREKFLVTLSHGARWHMIAAMSLVGLSGIGLLVVPGASGTTGPLTLLGVKIALFLTSVLLFWRVSWYWWPARLFAQEPELPGLHRRFRIGACWMLVLVGANFLIGVLQRLG